MNKTGLVLLLVISLSACRKMALERMCISVNKTTASINETVTVENCSDRTPSKTELDWGDGTITDGLSGTHLYSAAGTYTIRVILRNKEADDDDLRKTVKVQ